MSVDGAPEQNWYRHLLARLVVPLCFHETFLILGRKLWPVYLDRELGQLACEFERHLIVLVVHRCTGV